MGIDERDLYATDDDPSQPPWPSPDDDHRFTDGCRHCEATRAALAMEFELRECSLRLWVAGWSPIELMDEVLRETGLLSARDFVVQMLLVDDSHRSAQARPAEWTDGITALRAMTGITDVSTGWFMRWLVANDFSVESECIANGTLSTLHRLLHPQLAA